MVKIENECCDCAIPAYPCRGNVCPLRRVVRHYCDNCGEEIDGYIYDVDDEEFCEECLLDRFRRKD